MALKRSFIFSTLAIFYFIACVFGANAVSQSIADYIGQNGWERFNTYAFYIGGFLAIVFVILCGLRLWYRRPNLSEIMMGLFGFAVSFYILYDFVLLTTELIHIPQFLIFTLLLCFAFPKDLFIVLIVSSAGCIVDEWVQSFMPNRVLDLNDIFLNFIGLYVGLLFWWCISIFFSNTLANEPQAAA